MSFSWGGWTVGQTVQRSGDTPRPSVLRRGLVPGKRGVKLRGHRVAMKGTAAAGRHAHSLGRRARRNSDGKGGVRPRSTMLLLRAPLMRASLGWGAWAWRGPG